ncbi:unnamed protein product [Larinioides sclopetarius]|uniref:Glutamate receptor 1 n=1 Tax=Larinioides sclopetarius TaxID=280406 RepID=A0AAV2A7D4_9ARAC
MQWSASTRTPGSSPTLDSPPSSRGWSGMTASRPPEKYVTCWAKEWRRCSARSPTRGALQCSPRATYWRCPTSRRAGTTGPRGTTTPSTSSHTPPPSERPTWTSSRPKNGRSLPSSTRRATELLKDPFIRQRQVVVRQFLPHQEYRKLLKELGRAGIKNIVIDVPTKNVQTVLKHAQQVDMMSEYHNYFITSLDLHTVDLEDFQYGGTNITGFKLVDEESPTYADVLESWRGPMFRQTGREPSLTTEAALLYDATRLFSRALTDLDRGQKIHIKSLSCETEEPWPHGISLINYMRMINVKGLTGDIKFDHHGFRSDFKLKAGEWNIHTGLNMTTNYTRAAEEIIQSLKNKTLIATTIINAPYTMLKENHESLEGNDKYEGYCIDLLREIAKIIGFHFKIKQRADIAIADLTITFQREQAVDFTMPFMNLGISILFRKPTKKVPKLFSFLSPLSLEVWVYMATAFLGVSLFLFIVARFSPYEWTNPHPCDPSPDVLQNQFTLLNTLWFTVGCLMQQGCELTPRALSTRVVACIWWFFTLIMVSSYTANLAAFLTVERLVSPIEGAEDLAKQSHIQYGCVESGATQTFFKESSIPTFKRMWAFMQSARPSVFTESNAKGVERVKKENYAFLMESTSIEYIVERECDLMQIGGLLDNKGYGVATPSGSPYRTPLSSAILKLQESGALHILKERWWKQRLGGGKCSKDETSTAGSASALSLANVGGVFVVLGAGLLAACIVAIVEFEPLCVLFCRELRFAIFCGGSTKPILPKHSPDDRQPPENGLPFMPLTGFSSVTTKDNFS